MNLGSSEGYKGSNGLCILGVWENYTLQIYTPQQSGDMKCSLDEVQDLLLKSDSRCGPSLSNSQWGFP